MCLQVHSQSLFFRRFLLPEYLPYAGIFHERGQPGLATHSSVNRVLAGNEISLFEVVVYVIFIFFHEPVQRTHQKKANSICWCLKSPETRERTVGHDGKLSFKFLSIAASILHRCVWDCEHDLGRGAVNNSLCLASFPISRCLNNLTD